MGQLLMPLCVCLRSTTSLSSSSLPSATSSCSSSLSFSSRVYLLLIGKLSYLSLLYAGWLHWLCCAVSVVPAYLILCVLFRGYCTKVAKKNQTQTINNAPEKNEHTRVERTQTNNKTQGTSQPTDQSAYQPSCCCCYNKLMKYSSSSNNSCNNK